MKFIFVPKRDYKVGDIIIVNGKKLLIDRFAKYGQIHPNFVARTLADAPKFEQCLCIQADEADYIVGIPA